MKNLFSKLFGIVQPRSQMICYYDYNNCYTYETNDATGYLVTSTGKINFVKCGC